MKFKFVNQNVVSKVLQNRNRCLFCQFMFYSVFPKCRLVTVFFILRLKIFQIEEASYNKSVNRSFVLHQILIFNHKAHLIQFNP